MQRQDDLTVALLGAGKMAEALISGWLVTGTLEPGRIRACNRKDRERLRDLECR